MGHPSHTTPFAPAPSSADGLWNWEGICLLSLLTWQGLGPFDHVDQLPLPQLIQAGQQVGEGVRLAVVVASTHHPGLDGLQDVEEDGLALVAINACHHQLGSLLLCGAG